MWNLLAKVIGASPDTSIGTAFERAERILRAETGQIPSWVEDDLRASAFRTASIGVMVEGASDAFVQVYERIMSGTFESTLLRESVSRPLSEALRTLGKTRIYNTPSTLKLELMGRSVVTDLMDLFWEGALKMPRQGDPDPSVFAGKACTLISSNYRRVFQEFAEQDGIPEFYGRLQLVTDHVCGMTDSFAKRLHTELFNG